MLSLVKSYLAFKLTDQGHGVISNPVNSFLKWSGEAGPRQGLHIHNLNGFDIRFKANGHAALGKVLAKVVKNPSVNGFDTSRQ